MSGHGAAMEWVDQEFDYEGAMMEIECAYMSGDDEESLEDAIEEIEFIVEEWQDIYRRLVPQQSNTWRFLEISKAICTTVINEGRQKIRELQGALRALQADDFDF
jgi:hypothetical protein